MITKIKTDVSGRHAPKQTMIDKDIELMNIAMKKALKERYKKRFYFEDVGLFLLAFLTIIFNWRTILSIGMITIVILLII